MVLLPFGLDAHLDIFAFPGEVELVNKSDLTELFSSKKGIFASVENEITVSRG